ALLRAWERVGGREQALQLVGHMQELGMSPSPVVLLDLYQWCVEEGDLEGAACLEGELMRTGKAQYLAALSSPSC
ncbi:hypothetical protein CYMTET_44457, partial [Cymbomonas tetramitiformis]